MEYPYYDHSPNFPKRNDGNDELWFEDVVAKKDWWVKVEMKANCLNSWIP